MLLIDPEVLNGLLLHSREAVRHSAVKGLRRAFRTNEHTAHHILTSLEEYGVDSGVSLTSALKCFPISAGDMEQMARLFVATHPEKSSKHTSVRKHLEIALLETPFELLEENRTVFTFNRDLRHIFDEAKRIHQLYQRGGEYLWKKLVEHTERGHMVDGVSPRAIRYARMLVVGLKRYPQEIKHRILMNISRDKSWHDELEEYLVELAGELRLREAIDPVYGILRRTNPDRTMHGRAIKALGLMGGDEVIRKMAILYHEREEERYLLTEVFPYIPHDYTEKTLLDFLQEERDSGNISFLIYALAEIYSRRGMEMASEILEARGLTRMQSEMQTTMDNVEVYYLQQEQMAQESR